MRQTDFRHLYVRVERNLACVQFFQRLKERRVAVFQLKIEKDCVRFYIKKSQLYALRQARHGLRLKVSFHMERKAILQPYFATYMGILLLFLIPFVSSFFTWQVVVVGDTPELTQKVEKYIGEELRLTPPIAKNDRLRDDTIRQSIMGHIADLSWVHIEQSGSILTLKLQEAPKTKQLEKQNPMHLIATKGGVITHSILQSGDLLVEKNETVQKGDLLASGVLQSTQHEDLRKVVGAVGEVFANYWLKTSFRIERKVVYFEREASYWSFQKNFSQQWQTIEGWKLMWQQLRQAEKLNVYKRHVKIIKEDDIASIVLPLVRQKLLQDLPSKTTIRSEKLLHVAIDNDTVVGEVLYLVNENIAMPISVSQGE